MNNLIALIPPDVIHHILSHHTIEVYHPDSTYNVVGQTSPEYLDLPEEDIPHRLFLFQSVPFEDYSLTFLFLFHPLQQLMKISQESLEH